MYQDNNWYAHRKVFLDYCNIDYDYSALAAIQHGWMNVGQRGHLGKRSFASLIPYLCWSKNVEHNIKERINFESLDFSINFSEEH